jgi:hypothetical protein
VTPAHEVAREARALARLLANVEPTDAMVAYYRHALPSADAGASRPLHRVDVSLLESARGGPTAARVADAYARFFRPRGPLRRRIVLMLAILENSPEAHAALNSGVEGSFPVVAGRLVLTGVAGIACLLAGVLRFSPVHLTGGALPERAS